jgi:hypothetical protein
MALITTRALACAGAAAVALWACCARASESGASLYLLGSGGPEAAIMPPLPGVFLDNTAWYYQGDGGGGRTFNFGGNVIADVHASIPAYFGTLLWQPDAKLFGANFAMGVAVPTGGPSVHAGVILTGPRGRQFGIGVSDSAWVIGDPILTGMIGWTLGPRTFLQVSSLVNVPVGDYREGEIANLAFHRWAGDLSLAATWHDEKSGWDLSGKVGFTFNGTNEVTDYTTGTESHYELSAEKTLSPSWSAGVQAYYFYQLSGDSGSGATLGPFEGRVGAVGGNVTWRVKAGIIPLNVRVRGMHEFNATNRLEGDSLWLDVSLPLHVKLPPGAHP